MVNPLQEHLASQAIKREKSNLIVYFLVFALGFAACFLLIKGKDHLEIDSDEKRRG
jgi:hypothetical protein